jgi:hypothetical protein
MRTMPAVVVLVAFVALSASAGCGGSDDGKPHKSLRQQNREAVQKAFVDNIWNNDAIFNEKRTFLQKAFGSFLIVVIPGAIVWGIKEKLFPSRKKT